MSFIKLNSTHNGVIYLIPSTVVSISSSFDYSDGNTVPNGNFDIQVAKNGVGMMFTVSEQECQKLLESPEVVKHHTIEDVLSAIDVVNDVRSRLGHE